MLLLNKQQQIRIDIQPLCVFLKDVARAVGLRENDFSVTLVGNYAIQSLNRKFRKRNSPTDVLSFPAGNVDAFPVLSAEEGPPRLGEIVISAPTARRQARREGHTTEEEIKLLIIHGVLHLMGYDHETDNGKMNRKEYALRAKLL